MTRRPVRILSLPLLAAMIAACSAAATPTPVPTPPPAPTPISVTITPTPTANPCDKSLLKTLTAGKLTIGTDNIQRLLSGQGFESAVAYAVAGKLDYANADVVLTVVPFDDSYKPGAKPFDFYLAQVSYTADRAQQVDMSDGYYFVAQAVVSLAANPIAGAKSIADLKNYKIGAQQGTMAYDTIQNVIAPSTKTSVYDSNDAAIQALKAQQIDGLVVDLPTAFDITSTQLDNSVIVGQFPVAQGASAEHFSLVLAKGSSMTTCVNSAIASLNADGTLAQIITQWLSEKASVPIFTQ